MEAINFECVSAGCLVEGLVAERGAADVHQGGAAAVEGGGAGGGGIAGGAVEVPAVSVVGVD